MKLSVDAGLWNVEGLWVDVTRFVRDFPVEIV